VGIGGAYLCIYGMEGPGGYQFVGRTIQQWNRYRTTESFREGKPWLLRFFDQIRWYPVTTEELAELRHDFIQGRFNPEIETTRFSIGEYNRFLEENSEAIQNFKSGQQAAFEEERERWAAAGVAEIVDEIDAGAGESGGEAVPEGMEPIDSFVAANVWKVFKNDGDSVGAGERVAILEAMKTEFIISAPRDGTVWKVVAKEGAAVAPGEPLLYLEPS
jgi:urea carboxylase